MADEQRIEELEQRLRTDPASIAFAHLAEEYRRAGRIQDAIATCRAGLARHPGYLSARVTLGRALLELGELDAAQEELDDVRRVAPENLAAIRGLAEVHRRRGELSEALEQYRSAFELAQNDPGIDQIVKDLRRQIDPGAGRGAGESPARPATRVASPPALPPDERQDRPAPIPEASRPIEPAVPGPSARPPHAPAQPAPHRRTPVPPPARSAAAAEDPESVKTRRVVLLLERWIEGIVADRRARIYGARA